MLHASSWIHMKDTLSIGLLMLTIEILVFLRFVIAWNRTIDETPWSRTPYGYSRSSALAVMSGILPVVVSWITLTLAVILPWAWAREVMAGAFAISLILSATSIGFHRPRLIIPPALRGAARGLAAWPKSRATKSPGN